MITKHLHVREKANDAYLQSAQRMQQKYAINHSIHVLLSESMPVCVSHASIVHPQTYSGYHVSSSKSLAKDREYTAFGPSTVFSAPASILATWSRLLVPTAYQPVDGIMR